MISVVMTTYNGEKYLERQLNSLLNQSRVPDEIIICDDASQDNTPSIIKRFANSNKNITFYQNDKNIGYRANFRKAIQLSKGDFLFLCDQDDEWELDKIEKMMAIMIDKRCSALCCDYSLIDENSQYLDKSGFYLHPFIAKTGKAQFAEISFHNLIFGNILQGCTYCFTKKVKDAYLKLQNQDVDHDQQIMFVATLCGKVFFYKDEMIRYRIHQTNAIGLQKVNVKNSIAIKKPSKKPFMVQFMNELDTILPIKHKAWYCLLFYLRIPYFVSKIR